MVEMLRTPTLPAGIPPHTGEGALDRTASVSPSPLWGGIKGGGTSPLPTPELSHD
jgi:hypothetical protein